MRLYLFLLLLLVTGVPIIGALPVAQQGIAVFLLALLLWAGNVIPLLQATLFIPALSLLLGLLALEQLASIFLSPILAIFVFGFTFACFSKEQGLDKVALHTISHLSKGDERKACYLLFALTCFISMWTSNVVTAALMLPIVLSIDLARVSGSSGSIRKSKAEYISVGVIYSATLGGMCTQVGSSTSLIASSLAQLDFIGWLSGALPIVTLLWLAMLLLLEGYFKPEFSRNLVLPEPKPLTKEQKWGIVIILVTLVTWVLAAALLRGQTKLYGLIPLIAVGILLAKKLVTPKGALKAVRWRVIVIFVSAFSLGKVLHSSGGGQLLVDWLTPLIDGSPTLFQLAIFLLLLTFMTEFMSNVACASLFAPVLFLLLVPQGVTAEQVALMVGIGGSFAFILPTATPANNLAYANQYVTRETMTRFGIGYKLAAICILFMVVAIVY